MERWREDDPCALVNELARSINPGLWLNILVADVMAAIEFQTSILGAEAIYQDEGFAIMRHGETFWMMHADNTYAQHPMSTPINDGSVRGVGCEIRIHGCNPDEAEQRARDQNFKIMAPAQDKPHGLRESFLVDQDGYVWVPSILKSGIVTDTAAA